MRTRIKICGITNLVDALLAVELGADALGFIFYPKSPRYLQPSAAREIIEHLPPLVTTVAVMVKESLAEATAILQTSRCQVAQLHGDESPDYLWQLGWPAIKSLPIAAPEDLAPMADYPCVRAFLLDTQVPGQHGGTGKSFDWHIARQAREYGKPVILAGGLRPDNVAAAIRMAEPWAIDVSSGVECAPGRKDAEQLRRLFAAVKRADRERG